MSARAKGIGMVSTEFFEGAAQGSLQQELYYFWAFT